MERTREREKKGKRSRKRLIWMIVIGVALLVLIVGGIEAYRILYTPQNLFAQSTFDPSLLATTQAATQPPTDEPADSESQDAVTSAPTDAPTVAPTPDITQTKDIVNILLIGIDRRYGVTGDDKGTPKGEGTDPHADVQMIVSINFKQKKVDLISLPRDTFVYNPDLMDGVYKLNATFNVGGGFSAKNGAGFLNVCKGASYMLGGIPVDYYYAVDFDAVVKMVDAIGGVDFSCDSSAYSRQHKKGMQHMSGMDVLFFLRVRHLGEDQGPGDLNRINRQKEMMVAIFDQLKKKGQLSMVPKLIGAADSGVYTNTNLEQTLALANYAMNIDPKKIGMYSFSGPMTNVIGWHWCFTDQKNRIDIIKKVYGVDVPEQTHCTLDFAQWLRSYGFDGMVYKKTAKQLLDYADAHLSDFTDDQLKSYHEVSAEYTDLQKAWDSASLTMKSKEIRTMLTAMNKLKKSADALSKSLNYPDKLKWTFDNNGAQWDKEPKINSVWVDFS